MRNLGNNAERRITVVGYVIFAIIIFLLIQVAIQIGNNPERISYGSF